MGKNGWNIISAVSLHQVHNIEWVLSLAQLHIREEKPQELRVYIGMFKTWSLKHTGVKSLRNEILLLLISTQHMISIMLEQFFAAHLNVVGHSRTFHQVISAQSGSDWSNMPSLFYYIWNVCIIYFLPYFA